MLHYVQEVSYFKNLQVLGEWSVAPTNKCSSEMKAALLPRSYVERVGQFTWGKNLLLLCSHPSNSVLIVSMNNFKLVAVLNPLLEMSPTPWHGLCPNSIFKRSPMRKHVFYWAFVDFKAPVSLNPPKCIGLWIMGSIVLSRIVHCISCKFAPVIFHSSPNWPVKCLDCIQMFLFVLLHMNKWWVTEDSWIVLHAFYELFCDMPKVWDCA